MLKLQFSSASNPSPAWLDWLPRLYAPLLLLLCATHANRPLNGDIDTWAHAAIGRWIWQTGQIPQQSLFIWGSEPIRWIAHSWLSQLTFYGLLQTGGAGFVVAFNVLCVVGVFFMLWRFWAQHAPLNSVSAVLFAIGIACSSLRFYPRPELFTALCLTALLIFLCQRSRLEWRSQSTLNVGVGAIVAMFAFWANFHGAVAIGLVMLGLTLLGDGIQDRLDGRWRALLLLSICCAVATLLNPYGAELWEALRAVKSETFKNINEWKPVWKQPRLDPVYPIGEAILVLCALATWAGNRERRWSQALWVLFAAASFIGARRNLWVLAIVCLVVLGANAHMLETRRIALPSVWRAAMRLVFPPWIFAQIQIEDAFVLRATTRLGTAIGLAIAVAYATPSDFWQFRTVSRKAPTTLSRFFKSARLEGRVFTDYEYSSYWQWSFGGKPPLFIDLLNAYPDHLLNDYFQILERKPHGLQLLKRVEIVLLRPGRPNERIGAFSKYLDSQPQTWVRVYRRHDGSLWLRKIPKYRRVWSRALKPA